MSRAARITKTWAPTAARIVLAVVLGYAGLVRIQDLNDAGRSVAVYRIVPDDLAELIGGALPFAEIAVALLLVAGLATRVAAVVTAVLLIRNPRTRYALDRWVLDTKEE
ncbi:DoxX family protein [Streptomyces sp. ITFR-6]|uniref:DoxX family protein n=1 Tax=Streptomyces sp. ITFR-6 TaxID=3075197 RepID=UPI00288AEE5B|nr:DoxX family protein [Streptomyces sp. ITFR-6]WNI32571.1 DoxX family protein [Streptomyces sp. ITFR-6]